MERESIAARTADGNTTNIRGDRRPIIEAIVGENVIVLGIASPVTSVTQTAGSSATVDDATITVGATGRQVFDVGNGTAFPVGYLEVFGCEPACLTKISERLNPASPEGASPARARTVLRNLCNHDASGSFDGTVATIPANLSLYGADAGNWDSGNWE